MSTFDPPNIKGAISPFRSGIYDTFAEHASDIIGLWIIEQLKTLYPTHKTKGGDQIIYYSWFFDLQPKEPNVMALPAVAVDVVIAEHPTLGTAIGDGEGGVVAGALRDAEIAIVVIANSARMSASIEGRVARILDRVINFAEDIPLTHVTKYHFADDRGFSSIDRFVMTSLWQNLSDEAFVKLTFYNSGFVEDYIEDTDEIWAGLVGGINLGITADSEQDSGNSPSHVTLSFKFTPTIP